MDTDKDIAILLMLGREFGFEKASFMWAYQKDMQWLEEARKKSNKWPRRFWNWYYWVDGWEKQAARSKERLKKKILMINGRG